MEYKYKYLFLLIFIKFLSLIFGHPTNYCGVDFAFAGTYGSHMVLQRAPARARIWGYGFDVGDTVTVSISDGGVYETTTTEGPTGRPVWRVDIDPVEEGGPYNITASSGECTLTLDDVLFGDVWICSGQSNMVHSLKYIDDPQPEVDDVVNYPNVRSFFTELQIADTPQFDVGNGSRSWAVPTSEIMESYSAICWLFGKRLYQKYGRPIGLIQAAWSGTRIEAWSSPAALEVCFGDEVSPPRNDENAASVLYNAMIHPHFPTPIYGAIWYQGESNFNNPEFYGCAIREMVKDWRETWFNETDTMDPQFPFGQVQLATTADRDMDSGFPDVRWQQTFTYGFVPNEQLERFFMAVAMDLVDYESPLLPIHPRYKRQVADRLALGAFDVAYDDTSEGPHQGPLPSGFNTDGSDIVIAHNGFTLVQRGEPETYIGYEVCCSPEGSVFCPEGDSSWNITDIMSVEGSDVTISIPCDEGQFVTGVRYSWRTSPCDIVEECPIYADEAANNLPAAPFVYNGLISEEYY